MTPEQLEWCQTLAGNCIQCKFQDTCELSLKEEHPVSYKRPRELYPMGAYTFAVACFHCEFCGVGGERCRLCKSEVVSGFSLRNANISGTSSELLSDGVPSGESIVEFLKDSATKDEMNHG